MTADGKGRAAGRTFLFAGGGSGGHISPALAVVERLGEAEESARALVVCSKRPLDSIMLREAKVRFETIPASPFSVRPAALVRFGVNFRRSRREARALIRREAVERVIALGGFVAAPVVAAAVRDRVPVTLLNLDAPPGKANRWMARRCEQVLSAIEIPPEPGFAPQVVGMPIRRSAVAPGPAELCRRRLGLDPDAPLLLVTGASPGARSINDLLAALLACEPQIFSGWQVCHLCGGPDVRALREAYAAASTRAMVTPFLHEMGLAWGSADLAISRAGASSVAEARANTVPTIFMPYPYHRDRHQENNAKPMVDAGGAVIETDHIDPRRNAQAVGATLAALMADHQQRAAMRQSLRSHPAPDAAETVARMLVG